jgi:hypothetical protein
VRVGFAPGRAVKFGEGQRGAQFETSGFLGLRDGYGGEESAFGGVGGVLFEEDFAANAVGVGLGPALTGSLVVHCEQDIRIARYQRG